MIFSMVFEMKHFYQVKSIEFDFDGEDLSQDDRESITEEAIACVWDSPTEDDLVDTISDVVGYCIKSIDYDIVWLLLVTSKCPL